MKKITDIWNRFWFSKCDPLPAALCRILTGLLLLAMLLAVSPSWERYYAADGVMSLNAADLNEHRIVDTWTFFSWTEGLLPIRVYWVIGMFATLAFLVGFFTRTSTVVLYVLLSSMIHRSPYVVNGEDLVLRMVLLYGIFAPLGGAWSVDAWLRNRKVVGVSHFQPQVWAIRMLQINFALIYIISLPYKIGQDADWLTGDAFHWTVASDMWWIPGFLPEISYAFGGAIRKALTWGTLVVEGLFPILVCIPRTRLWAIASVTMLHIGIAVLVPNVTFFSLSMLCGFCTFLPPAAIRAATAYVGRLFGQLLPRSSSLRPARAE